MDKETFHTKPQLLIQKCLSSPPDRTTIVQMSCLQPLFPTNFYFTNFVNETQLNCGASREVRFLQEINQEIHLNSLINDIKDSYLIHFRNRQTHIMLLSKNVEDNNFYKFLISIE